MTHLCLKKSTCVWRGSLRFIAGQAAEGSLRAQDGHVGFWVTNKGEKIKLLPDKEKKEKAKKFLVSQEKRNLQGHTTEVAPSKSLYPRCPWEEAQQNSCNGQPWLLMKGFAWRRGGERLDREESQLFLLLKGKKPRRSCTMVCGTRQNI